MQMMENKADGKRSVHLTKKDLKAASGVSKRICSNKKTASYFKDQDKDDVQIFEYKLEPKAELDSDNDEGPTSTSDVSTEFKTEDSLSSSEIKSENQCLNSTNETSEVQDLPQDSTKWSNHFPCEVCGKVFKWHSHLKKHFLTHSGEKPHSCILCGKCFSQSGSLKTHLLKHTGVRPYACQLCGKTFTESGKLNIHTLTHTGEKPYGCTLCDRRFPTVGNLKKHSIVHTGVKPYVCSECGKGFGKNDTLKKHMTTHTGEKPYKCEICDRCFGFRSAYKRHVRTHLEKHVDT